MSDMAPSTVLKPRAVVIGHAGFAAGLISAVDQITGRGAMLIGISNAGMTPEQMEAAVAAHVMTGVSVVFTDLPAGSATICAKRVCGRRAYLVVVSGVNLPALLDFVLANEASPESAAHAAARGRDMIGILGGR